MRALPILLFALMTIPLSGQWRPTSLPGQTTSDIAVAIEDMNGDLLEDIVTFTQDGEILLLQQMPDHSFSEREIGRLSTSLLVFSVVVADFNNDHLKDFVIAGETFVPRIYLQQDNGEYQPETVGFTTVFAQGANALDVDGDGWVDLFVCNDVGESLLYRNVAGILEEWDLIDMTTSLPSDNSGNYSSIWLDVDNDNDMDLYIAKCRAGVTDPADPRRINALYINDEGAFREAAADYNVAIGDQSWSVSAGDLDNDGDEDIYLTNHYAPDQILVNEGDRFEVINLDFLPEHFAFQAVIADLDLDGRLDVVVTGEGLDFVLFNRGNLQFELDDTILADFQSGLSITCGDIDNDGDLDLYKTKGDLGSDIVLLNPASEHNNWVKLSLIAPSAATLQSSLVTYIDGVPTVHTPRSGMSYGVHQSTSMIIGLGPTMVLDSVDINWYGATEATTIYKVQAGEHRLIYPDGCVGDYIDAGESALSICESDVLSYEAPAGYLDYSWSDGTTEQAALLSLGTYQVTMTDQDGCSSVLAPISVIADVLSDNDLLLSASSICNNSAVIVEVAGDRSVLWSDGFEDDTRTFTEATTVIASVISSCGDTLDTILDIQELAALAPLDSRIDLTVPASIPITAVDTFVLRGRQGELRYRGTDYISPLVTSDTTFIVSTHVIGDRTLDSNGIAQTSTSFASDQFNSGIEFTVEQPIVLRSVDVYTDKPGVRRFVIEAADYTLWESDIQVDSGHYQVDINVYIESGEYVLRTVTAVNQASLGHPGPRFGRDRDASFPYVSPGLVLNTTLNGAANYYYFYNWQYDRDLAICESDASIVDVRVVTAREEEEVNHVMIYPNPSTNMLFINIDTDIDQLSIKDLLGRSYNVSMSDNMLDVSQLPAGTYCLIIDTAQKISTHLFVKL